MSQPGAAVSSAGSGRRLQLAAAVAFTLAAVLVVVSPQFPPLGLTPNRDSGVFLYVAQRMLEGGLPYRDVWDHKPPAVYLLNLPPALARDPGWVLWLQGAVAVGAAAVLLGSGLRSGFGEAETGCGLAAGLALLAATYKGNLPEEYALPIQAAAVVGFSALIGGRRGERRLAFAIGVLGGLALLFKPTLGGLWLAMAITATVSQSGSIGRHRSRPVTIAALAGGLAVVTAAGAALVATGSWPWFWSSVFEYNLAYATGGDRLARWGESLSQLGPAGIAALCGVVVLYAAGLAGYLRRRLPDGIAAADATRRGLQLLALIDLPLEALLALGSGRLYLQYLTPWVPGLVILTACAVRDHLAPGASRGFRWGAAGLVAGLAASVLLSAAKVSARQAEGRQVELAVEAVGRTPPASAVLVWGAETQVLALSGRRAPTRYVYLYPLITTGYGDEGRLAEFAAQLQADPPSLVIDTSATNPVIPPLDPAGLAAWRTADPQYDAPAGLGSIVDWLEAHYRPSGPVGAWDVYLPVNP